MSAAQIAFWVFCTLTVVFAGAMLWRILTPAKPQKDDDGLDAHAFAVSRVVATGPDADAIKAIADAISTILKALSDFGGRLDTLGPTALLGVFTAFFALLTLFSLWVRP